MPEPIQQPQGQPTPAPCTSCNGQQGTVADTSSNGVLRQTWHSCTTCHGTGRA